jgi:hypothetical protein
MKENIKLVLLGIIAVTGIIITYLLVFTDKKSDENLNSQNSVAEKNVEDDSKITSIHFDNLVHDFGKIKQNTTNKCEFEFQNSGTEPLQINNATGSCGCTVPDYPRSPIAPGKKAKILVVYKPALQEQYQEKIVTITANTKPAKTQLKIRAYLIK